MENIIVEVLHRSEENGDSETKRKAAILINLVVNIDFICGILLLKNFMYETKLLSDFLQGESIDMAAAMVENFGGCQISKLRLYYRTQFYAVMDTLACELKDKLKLVKDTFNDFLLALNPDNPGPPEAIARLVASFSALFFEESSSGIHNELQIFFLYVRKNLKMVQGVNYQRVVRVTQLWNWQGVILSSRLLQSYISFFSYLQHRLCAKTKEDSAH